MSRRVAETEPELPGYDFIKLLGSGGFSDVFLYQQRLPRRKVAVKVLLTDELNPQARNQFVAEANLMAQLSTHPYIVTIYHADVAGDDRPYFVMEYCSGPSLAERYKRERFGAEDALRIGVRLSSAVATAHAAGILHRDIKPANVLTNDFGWPALTDFGISSTLESELPVHTTTTTTTSAALRARAESTTGSSANQSVGMSVPWSPPEMFDDDPKPDVRSDVFALAATIYTLLAAHTPFEVPGRSNGTLDLIGRIERGVVTPMNRDDVPRSLISVLNKGMAARRDDRFQTAIDFARALQRVELELGYNPTSIEVPNLVQHPRTPERTGDGADETRLRPVATIVAQPPAAARPQATPHDAPLEPTRLRGMVPVVEAAQPARDEVRDAPDATVRRPAARPAVQQPDPAADPGEHAGHDDAEVDAAKSRKRRTLLAVLVVACVLIVGGGVTAAVLSQTGTPLPVNTRGADDGGGGDVITGIIPAPVEVSAEPDASKTAVTFSWKNPKPKPDDHYLWQQEGANTPRVLTAKTTATVTGLAAGEPVCIDVNTVRAGRTSDATKMCSR
ncbi:MAG TPA: protein kinase [Humibacter sp.]|nr:protein kinase [Humibacter sp.]